MNCELLLITSISHFCQTLISTGGSVGHSESSYIPLQPPCVISSAGQSKLCTKSSTCNGYSTLKLEDFSSFLLEMTVVVACLVTTGKLRVAPLSRRLPQSLGDVYFACLVTWPIMRHKDHQTLASSSGSLHSRTKLYRPQILANHWQCKVLHAIFRAS